jgi:iron-sulfur cluster assembly accessory protein
MIQLSENAQKAIARLRAEQNRPDALLRVGVKGGGCSGMTYEVQFDDEQTDKDRVFDAGGVRVVCDLKSLLYVDGMTIDYVSDMMGSGFRFINPNAKGSCGCGTSFTA